VIGHVCQRHGRYVYPGERCPYCLGDDARAGESIVERVLRNLALIREALRAPDDRALTGSTSLDRSFTDHRNQLDRPAADQLWSR
jgi:hypothetical protein